MSADWVSAFLRFFDAQDRSLVAAGFPATSPWWRTQLERFLRSGRRRFILRVGRRGGKSSTLSRVAVAWALFGAYVVPPGDVGVVAFVSVSRDESAQRLRTIEAILRVVVGEKAYRRQGESIELDGRPVVFKTFAASISGVSGFTAILFVGDELAKWRDAETGANPATEVLASAGPTMATQPTARMFLCSSPFGTQDAHALAFDLGDTQNQLVARAATWEANPSVTEQATRELESDEKAWRREYAAIPQDGVSAAFSSALIKPAFRRVSLSHISYSRPVLALDASGGSTCGWASGLAAWGRRRPVGEPLDYTAPMVDEYGNECGDFFELEAPGKVKRDAQGRAVLKLGARRSGQPLLYVAQMTEFLEWGDSMGFEEVVEALAVKMRQGNAAVAVGDGYMAPALESEFRRHGLRFVGIPTSNTNKNAAMKRLRMLLAGQQMLLDEDATTEQQLVDYREKITSTGVITYAAKSGARADRVSVLVNLMIGEVEGHMSWSPAAPSRGRGEGSSPMGQHLALNDARE